MRMRSLAGTGGGSGVPALLAAAVFFLTACASATGINSFTLNPADGDRAVFTHEGLTIAVRYLDGEDKAGFLRASGREALERETRGLPLATFLLEVINGGGAEAVVDPAGTRFLTGFGPMISPMNYAHLYVALPRGPGRQTVLQEFQGVIFDRPVTVPAGGRAERLLFFQRPEKVAKDVAVVLDGLYQGGAQLKAVFAFKAVPLEE